MINIYDIVMRLFATLVGIIGKHAKFGLSKKASSFCIGQVDIISQIKSKYRYRSDVKTYWFHAASLGEFAILRPMIQELQKNECVIVVTFFSPTGIEGINHDVDKMDFIFYLPLDTHSNAEAFLNIIKPDIAIFAVSELWFNYLNELQRRHIPMFLVSAIVHNPTKYFSWYGVLLRRSLKCFSHIFALDEESKENLDSLGCKSVSVSGNPLFDNAVLNAEKEWHDDIVDKFCEITNDIFLAGSISDENDLKLIANLANHNQSIRFILVPHEISEERLNRIKYELKNCAICHSECNHDTDFSKYQSLIIDHLGSLPFLYRYAKWAYVGGGFTPYLHSVIEATVYGVPVSFGPRVDRKITPNQLVRLKIGRKVECYSQLETWLLEMRNCNTNLDDIKKTANDYILSNIGAVKKVVSKIKLHDE